MLTYAADDFDFGNTFLNISGYGGKNLPETSTKLIHGILNCILQVSGYAAGKGLK